MSVIRWIDGWDWTDAAVVSPFAKYPGSLVTFSQIAMIAGRYSGGECDLINSAFGEMNFTRTFTADSNWCAGFAFRPRRAFKPDYTTKFFRFASALGNVIALRYNPSAQLEILSGGALTNAPSGTLLKIITAFPLVIDQTNYLELVVQVSGANSVVQLWIDDVQYADFGPTGTDGPINLAALGNPNSATLRWESLGDGYAVDDYYVADSRLGPCRVMSTVPSADVATSWTRSTGASNFGCMKEFPWPPVGNAPDGDTTYVLSPASGHDLYSVAAFSCVGRILAVANNLVYKGTNTNTVDLLCRPDSTGSPVTLGSPAPSTSGAYEVLQALSQTNLRTGSGVWTDGDIALTDWGMRPGAGAAGRATQLVVEKLVSLRSVSYDCGSSGSYSYAYWQ